ncbi:GNAT family N-acetyltransferase [Paenibacillus dokdonensis]|uniref:GNAT family N-acetyltransferase n=1 Tax=Paenibacillus dokdonensis TaxID=2567944 RepID=A0ABU6GWM0_9BACL|nr:GNAT family N-acetyltransferase [Paenibacillus dokdonensis]MEC0244144.1 GNAT family N-acetyltransferase [Paenibacillus dokdonensis]
MKDEDQRVNEEQPKIMDVLKGIFGSNDSLDDLRRVRNYKPIPLKRKGDFQYEVKYQSSQIEGEGHRVLNVVTNKYDERVIIYRLYYDDDQDDININLRIRVITDKGVILRDPNIYLHVDQEDQHIEIADIRIEGAHVNRGYGSIVMNEIIKLAHQLGIKFIDGWISGVDWDHIDRSAHFYRKFGFDVELNEGSGKILWLNQELGATREEFERLIKSDSYEINK